MRTKRILSVLIAVLTAFSVLIPLSSMTAFAAASPGIIFDCLYSPSESKLTLTASVSNPDTDVNTAMFVLDYDKTLLTTDESKVAFTAPAVKSNVYYSEGHVGADWYYDNGLEKSAEASPAVTIEFSVKEGTSLDSIKNALSVCDDTEYLNSIGGYGIDGGLLLCVSSSEYYNAAQSTATSKFNFSQEQESTAKPELIFDSVYSPDKNEMVTTVAVNNPENKVGAAMFVLEYDSSNLTPKTSGSVSYLGKAKESKTYSDSSSGYIGADWYYDTALAASSTPTDAVKLVFDVADGTELDDLINALSICDDTSYLGSLGYKNDGGLLICESGTVFYNAASKTAEAAFSYEEAEEQPVTYTLTVTDGSAKVGEQAATSAKAGDTVTITAKTADTGYRFKEWQVVSGAPTLASTTASTTTFTMPAANVSVKAVFEPIPAETTYTLTVTDGTAKVNGQTVTSAKAGDVVTITAKTADSGYRFKNWQTVSGTPSLASVTSETTTFTMPTENVSLKAIFEQIPPSNTTYTLTVTNGSAKVNGQTATSAKAGDVVTITANAPATGYTFKSWSVKSGKITLANANSATTTFTMPASNVSVAAQYDDGKGPIYPTGDDSTTIFVAGAAIIGAASIFVLIVLLYRKRTALTNR